MPAHKEEVEIVMVPTRTGSESVESAKRVKNLQWILAVLDDFRIDFTF